MKKVLALVLAVMMLSTMAFAASDLTTNENVVGYKGNVCPGDTIYVWKGMDSGVVGTSLALEGGGGFNAEVTSKNYSLGTRRITEGKDLIESYTFNDDKNQFAIKFKEDYTLKQPKAVKGTIVLKGKGKNNPKDITITLNLTVGNDKGVIYLDKDKDRTMDKNNLPADNTVYKFQKITTKDVDRNGNLLVDAIDGVTNPSTTHDDYGTIVLECADGGETEVTFRAYKGDELFLYNKTSANSALLKAYADQDAEISFLTFEASPTLNSTATIRFYKDEDWHVYTMKEGKLVSEVKWDDDEDCFLLKTRTLGSYVFSDKALPFNVATPGNPDTGANDVVGIATALAAVALVSAAAVSLKK